MFDEFGINAGYVEELHTRWLQSPQSVEEGWRRFFEGTDVAPTSTGGAALPRRTGAVHHGTATGATNGNGAVAAERQWQRGGRRSRGGRRGPGARVGRGVPRGGSRDGHRGDRAAEPRRAPRQRVPRPRPPLRERRPARGADPRRAGARAVALRAERGRPRQDLLHRRHGRAARARATARDRRSPARRRTARSIGVEFTHIEEPEPRMWLQQQMESTRNRGAARSAASCCASSRSSPRPRSSSSSSTRTTSAPSASRSRAPRA